MTNYTLKKQLKKFAVVQPSPTWLAARREVLMRQIKGQVAEREQDSAVYKLRMSLWSVEAAVASTLNTLKARAGAVAALLVVFSLSSGGYVVAAAEKSIPGQSLYQIKLAVEDMRLNMTRSQKSRVALEVEFAARRLHEVKSLAQANSLEINHASVLVAQFEDTLANASQVTAQLSADSPEVGEELAKLVDARLGDYKHTLSTTNSSDTTFNKQLNKAISSVNRTETQTLKVMVANNTIPEPAVVDKIAQKINAAELSLREADEKLAGDGLFSAGGTKGSGAIIDDARQQSAVAKINLAEARNRIEEGDYLAAVSIIGQIEDMVYEVTEAVDEVADSNKIDSETSTNIEAVNN